MQADRLAHMVQFRASPRMFAAVQAEARSAGLTVSEYLRRATSKVLGQC